MVLKTINSKVAYNSIQDIGELLFSKDKIMSHLRLILIGQQTIFTGSNKTLIFIGIQFLCLPHTPK